MWLTGDNLARCEGPLFARRLLFKDSILVPADVLGLDRPPTLDAFAPNRNVYLHVATPIRWSTGMDVYWASGSSIKDS